MKRGYRESSDRKRAGWYDDVRGSQKNKVSLKQSGELEKHTYIVPSTEEAEHIIDVFVTTGKRPDQEGM